MKIPKSKSFFDYASPVGSADIHIPTDNVGRLNQSLNKALAKTTLVLGELKIESRELEMRFQSQIHDFVSELVPDLSAENLKTLESKFPEHASLFLSGKNHKKTFGVFINHDYKVALSHIQMVLASHIERGDLNIPGASFEDFRLRLLKIEEDRLEFEGQKSHIEAALNKFKNSKRSSLNSLGKSPKKSQAPNNHVKSGTYHSPVPTDDINDLVLFALTDIPTSGRTLILDMLMEEDFIKSPEPFAGAGGSFGGGGSTGDWTVNEPTASSDNSGDWNTGGQIDSNSGVGAVMGVAAGLGLGEAFSQGSASIDPTPAFSLADLPIDSPVAPEIEYDIPQPDMDLPSFDDGLAGAIDTDTGDFS